MKDWFDEWLNTPGPPEDNDTDDYYLDGLNEYDEQPPTILQEIAYLTFATAIAAIIGVFVLLITTIILLSIISLILHHQILQWAAALTLTALGLHWAKKKTPK